MAKHVIDNAIVTIGGVDLSARVESVELVTGMPNVTVTAMGDGWVNRLPSKIKNWSCRVNLLQDYTSSGGTVPVWDTLYDTFISDAVFALTVRPTTSTQSATNPTFSGNALYDGDFAQIAAAVGEANKVAISLVGAGTLSFLTSTTS